MTAKTTTLVASYPLKCPSDPLMNAMVSKGQKVLLEFEVPVFSNDEQLLINTQLVRAPSKWIVAK